LPLDIPAGQTTVHINLTQLMVPLEGGDLLLSASGIGQHGGASFEQLSIPFLLTPPDLRFFEACDENGVVTNMTFGQTAILVVGIASERPLEAGSAQLTQSGWAINAPATSDLPWTEATPPAICSSIQQAEGIDTWLYFRLKLDNSMVDGPGKAVFSVSDIDGLVKSGSLDLMFQHAPTEMYDLQSSAAVPERDLYTNVTVADLDGLDRVICGYNLYDEDDRVLSQSAVMAGPEDVFVNQLTWQYPVPRSLANTTLRLNITCVDDLQQVFAVEETLAVGPAPVCTNCTDTLVVDTNPSATTDNTSTLLLVSGSIAALLVLLGTLLLRGRNGKDAETAWGEQDETTMASLDDLFEHANEEVSFDESPHEPEATDLPSFIPEGWTLEDYQRWLDGPVPEGWMEEQWVTYVEEHAALVAHLQQPAEG
jgi:hypothetical protein